MLTESEVRSGDLRFLEAHLRSSDREELEALGYASAQSALQTCVEVSGRIHVLRDGSERPVCLYGLHPITEDINAPWMLGTTLIPSNRKSFWHHSQRVIREFEQEGKPLVNIVHRDNDTAIDWLSRLGFELDYEDPCVVEGTGGVFYKFFKR